MKGVCVDGVEPFRIDAHAEKGVSIALWCGAASCHMLQTRYDVKAVAELLLIRISSPEPATNTFHQISLTNLVNHFQEPP